MTPTNYRNMKWFFDWDGTSTLKSSLPAIASIGYSKNAARSISIPPWSHFANSYGEDYQRLVGQRNSGTSSTACLESFWEWQESLVSIERASIERVEEAGLFAGLMERDVIAAAARSTADQSVLLRNGLISLFRKLELAGNAAAILSINWSTLFIRQVLLCNSKDGYEKNIVATMPIHCNEIEFGSNGKLSRAFPEQDRGIWTAQDKLRILKRDLGPKGKRPMCVYVGDDSLDLACLLEVDVGICIRDQPLSAEQKRLDEALSQFGIHCLPISDWQEDLTEEGRAKQRLWWATDFAEILDSPLLAPVRDIHPSS